MLNGEMSHEASNVPNNNPSADRSEWLQGILAGEREFGEDGEGTPSPTPGAARQYWGNRLEGDSSGSDED